MKRVDVCASDDHDAIDKLVAAVHAIGGRFDGGDHALGVGLHRVAFPAGELTVFVDAWAVDVAGPAALVDQLVAELAGPRW